ncbi:MAG: elongation factor Ts [Clostridia bacterium]|nr:elongation factor Ts [Clostridia bacterium]
MNFTAKDVAALRETTGCGMMDCKKALTEADGNVDKAIELLREKGLAAQAKKASRIASEGMVDTYINEKVGVIIEVNSETDFVAKNAEFQALVKGAAKAAADHNPADVDALKACKFEDTEFTVEDILREKILKIGENMNIRRFERLEGNCVSYVHGGGSEAAMVLFEGDAANEAVREALRNVCMQIVAMHPAYLCREEVPAEVIENEKNILLAQIKNDPKNANKPENILEKMIGGKIGKYYTENCLLEQAYVRDDKISVGEYLKQVGKEAGSEVAIKSFVSYVKGEGLEKRVDDFAAEVASMSK